MLYYMARRVILFRMTIRPDLCRAGRHLREPGLEPARRGAPRRPWKAVHPLCVFRFDQTRRGLVVESIHPGVTREELERRTGFRWSYRAAPAGDPAAHAEELDLLRGRVRESLAKSYPRFARSGLHLAIARPGPKAGRWRRTGRATTLGPRPGPRAAGSTAPARLSNRATGPGAAQRFQHDAKEHREDPEPVDRGGENPADDASAKYRRRHRDLSDPVPGRHHLPDDLLVEDEAVGVGDEVHRLQDLPAECAIAGVILRQRESEGAVLETVSTGWRGTSTRASPGQRRAALEREPRTTSARPPTTGSMICGTSRGSYW